jgi:hypothetical protein
VEPTNDSVRQRSRTLNKEDRRLRREKRTSWPLSRSIFGSRRPLAPVLPSSL